jgi:predicted DNA-binding transcriptional regulator YafY
MKNYNRSLLVLKYLHDKTDEDHLATIKDINDSLSEHQLDADRGTIVDCIKDLQECGYDICCVRSTQNRYYMRSRPFTLAEVKLLVDAVQSSRFISEEQSREIVEKLSSLVGSYKGEILKRQLYIGSRAKANNRNISEYVEKIYSAITTNKELIFQYYDYNPNKEKVIRRDGKLYYFSPYYMIWNNDMYYVVGCGRHGTVMKYRVDRMTNLEVLDEDRLPMPDGYEVSDFFEKEFSMMAGETCTVVLLCKNALMGSIIDKFGEDVQTEVYDPEHFKVTVDVKLSDLFFGWVFASGGAMKIIGPEQARTAMEDMAKQYLTAEV